MLPSLIQLKSAFIIYGEHPVIALSHPRPLLPAVRIYHVRGRCYTRFKFNPRVTYRQLPDYVISTSLSG